MGTTSFQWAAVWLTRVRRERICTCVIDLKSLLFRSVDWKQFLAPLCSYSCILQTRSHDVSTCTRTQTHALRNRQTHFFSFSFFFFLHSRQNENFCRSQIEIYISFSGPGPKKKKDLTAHYFDKFGARDREEMEERGRKAPHAPNNR